MKFKKKIKKLIQKVRPMVDASYHKDLKESQQLKELLSQIKKKRQQLRAQLKSRQITDKERAEWAAELAILDKQRKKGKQLFKKARQKLV